ncbi:MAG: 50S ribosomal protein L10 [Vampirovibrionales bacterium]
MPTFADKQQVVSELTTPIESATAVVVADYRGFTVEQLNQLRAELRKEGATFNIAKNTLIKRMVAGTSKGSLEAVLKGPTALLIASGDPVAPVKVLKDFYKKAKRNDDIRGGWLDGQFLSAKDVDAVADLPSIDELRAKLAGCIAKPLVSLASVLSQPSKQLVYVMEQVNQTRQGA